MTQATYIGLTVAAVIIEAIFTPFFLHYQRPGICLKSFVCKMICATMFLSVGLLTFFYTGNTSEFAKFLIIGLASSWLGDLFLHVKQGSKVTFGIGMAFFAAAHVLYLISYSKATNLYFPDNKFLTIPEIICAIAIVALLFVIFKSKGKLVFSAPVISVFVIYGLILATMFVKAASFGIQYIIAGNPVFGGLSLALGGALFFSSDITLVMILIDEKLKKSYRLKDYNIGSYFLAQTLLAISVLFIGNI